MAFEQKIMIVIDSAGAVRNVKDLDKNLNKLDKTVDKNTDSFGKMKGMLTASNITIAATIGLTVKLISSSIDTTKKFESAISDLSAITGATGDDLEFLSNASREFGKTTTLSATQSAEAFKLIASAKPDLLESVESLKLVTKEAITLAEAAGSTLPDAADLLGASLNQFGAEADQASRFINVMAAGSKFGAASITDMSTSLRAAGTTAASANISFEETNASLQLLSTVAIKGEQAGTALRNIILKLQKEGIDKLNPSVVGLSDALKNLRDENRSTTELMKLFGLENVNAAQALLNQVDSLDELTGKLTDTNIAYDQAMIKVDNLEGDQKKLNSAWEEAQLIIGSKLNPSMRELTQTSTDLISSLAENAEVISNVFKSVLITAIGGVSVVLAKNTAAWWANQLAVTTTAASMNVYTGATTLATTSIARSSIATIALTGAMTGLRAVMTFLTGPIGLALAATSTITWMLSMEKASTQADILKEKTESLTMAIKSNSLEELNSAKIIVNEAIRAQSRKAIILKNTETMLLNQYKLNGTLSKSQQLFLNETQRQLNEEIDTRLKFVMQRNEIGDAVEKIVEKENKIALGGDVSAPTGSGSSKSTKETFEDANGAMLVYLQLFEDADRVVANSRTESEKLTDTIESYFNMLEVGALTQEEYNKAVAGQIAGYQEAEKELSGLGDELKQTNKGLISGLLKNDENAFENYKDRILDSFANMLVEMATKALMNPIELNITGSSQASSVSGGGVTGFIGDIFNSIFGKAGGGLVGAGGLYEVNERRPELLTVDNKDYLMMGSKNGNVTPNVNGGGSSKTTVIINNVDTGTTAKQETTTDSSGNETIEVMIEKTVNKLTSQGAFDNQFGTNFGIKRVGY